MNDEPESANDGPATYEPSQAVWELRARDRPGKAAWLGPIATALGLLSWLTPIAGPIVALTACGCGVISILTRRPYRIDWTAVVGICLGTGQLFLELVLLATNASGL
ncbi:hypothetical protein [Actinophytocola sp.]|uniref:hypothetical protein n=1 Tax=Actinophytocola sp. TaxID=1872138 RepID=UPI003D6A3209